MTIVDIMTHGRFDAEVECNVVYHCVNVSQSPPITCHIATQHTLENREYQLNYIVRMLRCNILYQVSLYFFESGYRRHRKRIMKPFQSVCPYIVSLSAIIYCRPHWLQITSVNVAGMKNDNDFWKYIYISLFTKLLCYYCCVESTANVSANINMLHYLLIQNGVRGYYLNMISGLDLLLIIVRRDICVEKQIYLLSLGELNIESIFYHHFISRVYHVFFV